MSVFNKTNLFIEDIFKKAHDFSADAFKIMLTNTAPVATNHLFGDLNEIAAGNGYAAGGAAVTMGLSNASGTETITVSSPVFTATAGSIGPFRYAVLYNATPVSPLKPLVGWWDNGSSVTLLAGDSETITVSNFTAS